MILAISVTEGVGRSHLPRIPKSYPQFHLHEFESHTNRIEHLQSCMIIFNHQTLLLHLFFCRPKPETLKRREAARKAEQHMRKGKRGAARFEPIQRPSGSPFLTRFFA